MMNLTDIVLNDIAALKQNKDNPNSRIIEHLTNGNNAKKNGENGVVVMMNASGEASILLNMRITLYNKFEKEFPGYKIGIGMNISNLQLFLSMVSIY